jgi:hypothetical protein
VPEQPALVQTSLLLQRRQILEHTSPEVSAQAWVVECMGLWLPAPVLAPVPAMVLAWALVLKLGKKWWTAGY